MDFGHKIPEFHKFKMLFLEQRAALQNVPRYTTLHEFHNFKMLFLEQRAALQNVPRHTTHELVLLMKAFSSRGSRCRCLLR